MYNPPIGTIGRATKDSIGPIAAARSGGGGGIIYNILAGGVHYIVCHILLGVLWGGNG